MADDTVRLVAVMEAQLRGFTKGMEQAAAEADRRFGQMERRMKQTESVFGKGFGNLSGLAAKLGAALSVSAIFGFAKGIVAAADALKDASDQLGISTQDLQALNSAARDTGAGTDRMKQGLATLSDGLGDAAKGEGNLAKLLRDLNIPLGTTMQVTFDLADATKNAATQNDKMSIATTAFGKAGKELVPLLNQGADGLRRLFDEAQKKGQVWDPETVAKLDNLNDEIERLKVALTGKFANPIADFVQDARDFVKLLGDPNMKAFFNWSATPTRGRLSFGTSALDAEHLPLLAKDSFQPVASAPKRAPVPLAASDLKKAADEQKQAIDAAFDAANKMRILLAKIDADVAADIKKAAAEDVPAALDALFTGGGNEARDRIKQAQELRDTIKAITNEADERIAEVASEKNIEAIDRLRDAFDITGAAGVRAFDNIGDALKQMLQQLAATAFQLNIMEPLLNSLLGKKGEPLGGLAGSGLGSFPGVSNGNIGTGFLGGLASLFGFAGGGSPPVGVPSIVGERGPELFIPRVPGTVVPNGGMGASVTIVNHNSFAGAIDAKSMMAYADQASRVAAVQTIGHIKRSLPGMMITASQRNL